MDTAIAITAENPIALLLDSSPLTVVDELWNIFSYYTMHTNANFPEVLKVNFVHH